MNIQSYVIYDMKTGHINRTVECSPDQLKVQTGPHESATLGSVEDDKHYVVNGLVVARPTLDIKVSGNSLYGVPKGSNIHIEDSTYTADGEVIDLEFPLPGTYLVQVECWPYVQWEGTFEN